MRVNLIAQSVRPSSSNSGTLPLSLTIRPACGLPGDYVYATDVAALLHLLKAKTDLPSTVLKRFHGDLQTRSSARLLGVEMSDRLLTYIGYFVD